MAENTAVQFGLDGRGILITRPRDQAKQIADAVEARGGNAIIFPSIEINARAKSEIEADAKRLGTPDITVFISRNAARFGFEWSGGQIAAIGPTTAAELELMGGSVDICPQDGFDTEHLLAEDAFRKVKRKTIRIIRGNAGRERLANTLKARGANVHYLSTYQRDLPTYSESVLNDLEQRWRNGGVAAVIVMSVQSLDNLLILLPDWCREQLTHTPLVTPAARVLKEALSRFPGCSAILATGTTASDIADSLFAATGDQTGSDE